jgi:hypothetical protein
MRDHPVSMKIALLVAFVAFVTPVHAKDPTGRYANSPNAAWFASQHNANGNWCWDGADAHIYDGDYKINADGSVTMPAEGGGMLTLPAWQVLPYNPADPNPTGQAVWWYAGGQPTEHSSYCFALGPLT